MIIEESIQINVSPEKVWNFWMNVEENFKIMHPQDHVDCQWIQGKPYTVGSICRFEQYFGKKLDKTAVRVVNVIPLQRIEFQPTNIFLRIVNPKITIRITPQGENACQLSDVLHFRFDLLIKIPPLSFLLRDIMKHTKEEKQYIKDYLEA